MDAVLRTVREFFASPVLLSAVGASVTADATGPSSTSSSSSPARSRRSTPVASGGDVVAPNPATRALKFILAFLQRHYKGLLAVVCLIAVAHAARVFIVQRNRQRQQRTVAAGGGIRIPTSLLASATVAGSHLLQRDHHAERKGNSSRQSCAISEVSSVARSSSSPQPYNLVPVQPKEGTSPSFFTQDGPIPESQYYPQSLMRDEDGRMYVFHRHGEYVEVWEADEYGQVKDSSANYGDPEEHCVELLSHFKRQASISMSTKDDSNNAAD